MDSQQQKASPIMYHALAHLYDWPGAMDFSEILAEKTRFRLEKQGLQPSASVLDLACGTGTIAIELAQQGWDMIGIDASIEMLEQARKKTPETLKNIQWREGDMRTFHLDTPVSAILCYTDSLNHLLSIDDLEKTFRAMHNALLPGGLLLFDVNTEANYKQFWQGSDMDEGPNFRLSFQSIYNLETGRAEVHITAEEHTENGFTVNEDKVIQCYHPESVLEKHLTQCGFKIIEKEPLHLAELFIQEEVPAQSVSENKPIKTFWQCVKD